MNHRILNANKIARTVAIVTLFGLLASTNQTVWAQRGHVKERGKQSASHRQNQTRSTGRESRASNKRFDKSASQLKPTTQSSRVPGNRFSMADASRRQLAPQPGTGQRSAYLHMQDIDGESRKRSQSNAVQGPLYPAGWESVKKKSANQGRFVFDELGKDELPSISRGSNRRIGRTNSDMGNGGGIFNSAKKSLSTSGDGGGLWNSATGPMPNQGDSISNVRGKKPLPSSFYGQDQETGEIIDFRANLKSGSQAGLESHSIVNSEGWDEVPEDLMFGFRAGNTTRQRSGFGPVKPNQIQSPRDLASGMPTGKRR